MPLIWTSYLFYSDICSSRLPSCSTSTVVAVSVCFHASCWLKVLMFILCLYCACSCWRQCACVCERVFQIFKDLLFVVASTSDWEKQQQYIPWCVWLGWEPLHPGPLWLIWHLNSTLTKNLDTKRLPLSSWMHHDLKAFCFCLFCFQKWTPLTDVVEV